MPWIDLPGGGTAHVCIRGARPKPKQCPFCKRIAADLLCDAPAGLFGETCDALICGQCATHVGPDRDLCPVHKGVQL